MVSYVIGPAAVYARPIVIPNAVTGPTGPSQGPTGPAGGLGTGPTGPTGPAGSQGPIGIGTPGPAGPQGYTGPPGSFGGTGRVGPTGALGPTGSGGTNFIGETGGGNPENNGSLSLGNIIINWNAYPAAGLEVGQSLAWNTNYTDGPPQCILTPQCSGATGPWSYTASTTQITFFGPTGCTMTIVAIGT